MIYLLVFIRCFCGFHFPEFLYKSICCGYSFELHRQVDAIQMGTHNIFLYKDVDEKYTGCNLKTIELLDCSVNRSNMVSCGYSLETTQQGTSNGYPQRNVFIQK